MRSFSKMNQPLLFKWCWRFANERNPNLGRRMGAGTPATLGEAMALVYGKK